MKLIRHLTWQNMKSSKTRTLVTLLGVIFSAAMFTAVATIVVSIQTYMIHAQTAEVGDYFIQYDYGTMEDLENLRDEKTAIQVGSLNTIGYTTLEESNEHGLVKESYVIGAGNDDFFKMLPIHLEKGRLPQNSSELVITRDAYDRLKGSGIPCEVGDTITLHIATSYDADNMELPSSGSPFDKTYSIVGISREFLYFRDYNLGLSSLITFDDGSQSVLWGRFFAKTKPHDAYFLADKDFGPVKSVHQELLNLYGISRFTTVNDLIAGFAAVLCLIIMVGSVSLIYNAFSISVSERTKQFGLLSSIGATRKQIRRSVFTEALILSAAGIPIGILSGYAGIALTLHLTHGLVDNLLHDAVQNGIIMKAIPSIPAFVTAGFVALATVLISAWIPARRATKITPIAAIRQTQDFQTPKRGIRAGKATQKIFGLPASLARKYYTVNRRKYRATVISLSISMVLFVSAGTFVQQLRTTANDQLSTDNYDFQIMFTSQEQLERIRSHPAIQDSALVASEMYTAIIPEKDMTEGYRKIWDMKVSEFPVGRDITYKYLQIRYLEDEVLREYLEKQGIDPEPYLDTEHPLALAAPVSFTVYQRDENGKATDRLRHTEQVLKDTASSITLIPEEIPMGVSKRIGTGKESGRIERELVLENGIPILRLFVPPISDGEGSEGDRQSYEVEIHAMDDGKQFAYYFRDIETGAVEKEPADIIHMDAVCPTIGGHIRELPFGIRETQELNNVTLIMPLSAAPERAGLPDLRATASDYDRFVAFLNEEDVPYINNLENEIQERNYIIMIQIFSYGFITLISLICICNVFNTISTNIALRRKDFGMLRSIGMKNREINRMLSFECLQYGLKSILWGAPISAVCSYFICSIYTVSGFELPWSAMAIAAGCIFLTVFITMFYAVSKLKKQNPMEAIRSEG